MEDLAEVVGESPGIVAVRDRVLRLLAPARAGQRLPSLLLLGETGTGKGLLARAIHRAGPRATGPFISLNCAALPETLFEAELFGVERGAFTDARQSRPGLLKAAHHGTLFLDEIGLLPLPIQAKLLTVLDERLVRRLGATRAEPVDVWIISATSRDLEAATCQHHFREDLYYRLAVVPLTLPPLRERGSDIAMLAERFLAQACADYGLPPRTLTPEAKAALLAHDWPGNVRELANVIERVALLASTDTITPGLLALPPGSTTPVSPLPASASPPTLRQSLEELERQRLMDVLQQVRWNISRAAAHFGLPRNTLRYRLLKLGLEPDDGTRRRRRAPSGPRPPAPSLADPPPTPLVSPLPAPRSLTVVRCAVASPEASTAPVANLLDLATGKIDAFGGVIVDADASWFDAAFGLEPSEDAATRAANAALAIRRLAGRTGAESPALTVALALHSAAAIVGREIPDWLLPALSEDTDLAASLSDLVRLDFLYPRPGVGYVFKHTLIQEVAYERSPLAERQRLHAAAARAYEAHYADRLDEHAAILTHHYGRGAQPERMIAYALLAGDRAAKLHANTEATTYYEQARAAAVTLTSLDARRTEIDAVVKLAAVGASHRDVIERDRINLDRARALAEQLADERRLAQVLYWLGRIDYVRWRPSAAIDYARRSLHIAERLQEEPLAAPPVNLMGRIYWQLSDFGRAAELLGRSAEQMRQLGSKAEEATAAGFAGVALAYRGDFDRAFEYVARGVEVAAASGNPFAEASAHLERGVVRGERGEWRLAIADFEHARRIAERLGDSFRLYVVRLFEGRSYIMAGEPAQARVLLEESRALAAQIGATFALAWQQAFLAEALLALGEPAAAASLCQETIRLAGEIGDRFPAACAQRTLAEALLRVDPSRREQAICAIEEAIRIHQEIEARPELARTYLTHAHLLNVAGQRTRAEALMAEAKAMFEQMGMVADMQRASSLLSSAS